MSILKFIKNRSVIAIALSVAMSFAFVAVAVNGATTISTNVVTGGTLSVTGLSTLSGGATTTTLTLLNGEVISNATDGTIQLGGIASTTSITLLNGETITNATDDVMAITSASVTFSGDITVSGDDITMGTNTSGAVLVGDGTNFNPVVIGTDAAISSAGALTINSNAVQGTDISLASEAAGDIMYNDGTDWVRLASSTDGYVLTLDANGWPSWAAAIATLGNTSAWTANQQFDAGMDVDGAFVVADGGVLTTTQLANLDGGIAVDTSNFTVDGTTGLVSIIQASSTRMSVFDTAYFGGSATSTFNSAGTLTMAANVLSDTDSTDSLGLTGTRWASTFSDNFTGNTITLDGATGVNILTVTDNVADALSIVDSSGDLLVFDTRTGAEVLTIGVPNTVLVGTASTSAIRVGDEASASTINGLVFGYCTIPATSITASSTNYADCASATGIISGDRVFVQATSSLPENFLIQAASSTAADTINVRIYNNGQISGTDTGVNSFNFWAVRD
jgi:hypothetical protein